jgi:hypothetical protein
MRIVGMNVGVVLAVLLSSGCASVDRSMHWFFHVPEGYIYNAYENKWEVFPMDNSSNCDKMRPGTNGVRGNGVQGNGKSAVAIFSDVVYPDHPAEVVAGGQHVGVLNGVMKMKKQKKVANLKRPHQIKWRTDAKEFEFFARLNYPKSTQEAELKKWFPKDWEAKLEELRAKQRAAGIDDSRFMPPAKRKVA